MLFDFFMFIMHTACRYEATNINNQQLYVKVIPLH